MFKKKKKKKSITKKVQIFWNCRRAGDNPGARQADERNKGVYNI